MTPIAAPPPSPRAVPLLVHGQRLDQPTFHARYLAMPPGVRAELIGGTVYMPSPLSNRHGQPNADVLACLGLYRAHTPGIGTSVSGTTILGNDSEPQPDAFMRLLDGGQTHLDADGYVVGCPEFVCEISSTTVDHDLNAKRLDYERYGAKEYLAVIVPQRRVVWFRRDGRRLVEAPADTDGIYRSEAFPGFWIDAHALLAGDGARLIDVAMRGLSSAEHAAFAATLTPPPAAGSGG